MAGLASWVAPERDVLRGGAWRSPLPSAASPAAVAVHVTISRPPLWSRAWRSPRCRTSSVRGVRARASRGRGPHRWRQAGLLDLSTSSRC